MLPTDKILITALSLPLTIGLDHWSRSQPSPFLLSLAISTPLASPASIDNLPPRSINYSTTSKAITALCQSQPWDSLEVCAEAIASCVLELGGDQVEVQLEASKVLAGGKAKIIIDRAQDGIAATTEPSHKNDRIELTGIDVRCIIGLNSQERLEKQGVVVDVTIPLNSASSTSPLPYKLFGDAIHDVSILKDIPNQKLGSTW